MKKSEPYLTVVIPCYNEARNLRIGALAQVAHFLEKKDYSWEVIIVDDGSTDESRKLIQQFRKRNPHFRLMKRPHQGKAAAVISGMLAGRGKILLFTDLDQATPISELDKLLPWFKKNYQIVIGSRNSRREGAPLLRRAMARGFMFLRSLILGLGNISDTQCGFKAFEKKAAREIFSRLNVYCHRDQNRKEITGSLVTAGFDVEMLFVAKKLGFGIKEVPVEWHYVETRRVNPLRDSWQGLVDLLKIRLNSLRGVYD